MAFSLKELFDSQNFSTGAQPRQKFEYLVWSAAADNENDTPGPVLAWMFNTGGGAVPVVVTLPNSSQLAYVSVAEVDHLAPYTWRVAGEWAAPGLYRSTGQNGYSFNTAGGTTKIFNALAHVNSYNSAGVISPAPFDAGLLNYNAQSRTAEGLEIDTSAYNWQINLYLSTGQVTAGYVNLLVLLTDTVCAQTFAATVDGVTFSHPEGTTRLKGASGSFRGTGDWELTMNFATTPNYTSDNPLTIGSGSNAIGNIVKYGWDYLSVTNKLAKDTNLLKGVLIPDRASVDQVYQYENWTGLLPGIF